MVDMRQGKCPVCAHNELIQAAPVEFGPGAPLVLSVTHEKSRWAGSDPRAPLGVMNIWVCRRCGFVQWFAFEPEKIPIGEEYCTRLIRGPDPGGPYR